MPGLILVTGADEPVGREVVRALHGRGATLRAAVPDKDKELGTMAELVAFDFAHEPSYAIALDEVERVFLLLPGTPQMMQHTQAFVDAATRAGVKHIVKLSAMGVDSGITLGRWHRESERIIEESGIAWTHLRPNGLMQDFLGPLGDPLRRTNTLHLPLGDAKVSLVDARDVARAAAEVLTSDEHKNRAYELTGPQPVSGRDIALLLSEATGKEIRYEDVPAAVARKGLEQSGMPLGVVPLLMELFEVQARGQMEKVTTAVPEITGREGTAFSEFAAEHREAWA